MDKRYQIFVSSTYVDLKDERSKVMQALMEMDCIPAGMELFPAADEDQWRFIEKVIDDCDYYLLIIGGRYGSVTAEGISYTEKEYDYAVSKGLKVIALIHGAPDSLSVAKSDVAKDKIEKLTAFKAKVSSGRLVKFWQNANELPGLVALSLSKTIKTYPAVGWVRANTVASIDALSEVNELRKRNAELEEELRKLKDERSPSVEDIAGLEEHLQVTGTHIRGTGTQSRREPWQIVMSWADVFGLIAPHLIQPLGDVAVYNILSVAIYDKTGRLDRTPRLDDQIFQTIKVQLSAHRLVHLEPQSTSSGQMGLFWSLSDSGREQMLKLRVVKKGESADG